MGNAALCSTCPVCHNSSVLPSSPQAINILLVGLDGAGKTTIAQALSREPVDAPPPTLGFRRIQLSTSSITTSGSATRPVCVFEVGGARDIRAIWRNYVADCHAVVFAVDAAAGIARCVEARLCLHALLHQQHQLHGKPLLVLANKQDVNSALDDVEMSDALQLERLANTYRCPTRIEACTARAAQDSGSSIDSPLEVGFRWLVGFVESHFESLNRRVLEDLEDQKVELQLQAESRRARIAARAAQEELAAAGESEGGINEDIPLEKSSTPLITIETPSPNCKLTGVSSRIPVAASDRLGHSSAPTSSSLTSAAVYTNPRHQPVSNSPPSSATVHAEVHNASVGLGGTCSTPDVHNSSVELGGTSSISGVHKTSVEPEGTPADDDDHMQEEVLLLRQRLGLEASTMSEETVSNNELHDTIAFPSRCKTNTQPHAIDPTFASQIVECSNPENHQSSRDRPDFIAEPQLVSSAESSEQDTVISLSPTVSPPSSAMSSASSVVPQPGRIKTSSAIFTVPSPPTHIVNSSSSFDSYSLSDIVTTASPSHTDVTSSIINVTSSLLTYVTSSLINVTSSPTTATSSPVVTATLSPLCATSFTATTSDALSQKSTSFLSSTGSLPLPPVDEVTSAMEAGITSLDLSESPDMTVTSPVDTTDFTSASAVEVPLISSLNSVSFTSRTDTVTKYLPPLVVTSPSTAVTRSTPTSHEIRTVEPLQKKTVLGSELQSDNNHVLSSRLPMTNLMAISESVRESETIGSTSQQSHKVELDGGTEVVAYGESPEAVPVWDSGRASGEETDSDISAPTTKPVTVSSAISRHSRFFRRFSSSVAPIQ